MKHMITLEFIKFSFCWHIIYFGCNHRYFFNFNSSKFKYKTFKRTTLRYLSLTLPLYVYLYWCDEILDSNLWNAGSKFNLEELSQREIYTTSETLMIKQGRKLPLDTPDRKIERDIGKQDREDFSFNSS